MNYSDLNTDLWRPIIVIGIISALTLLANILRSKVSFIKKTYVPTAVLAGFILLILRSLGIVNIRQEFLELITYHGIAIGFIAMSLRVKTQKNKEGYKVALKSGALIVSTYLIQVLIGLVIALVLTFTFMPDFFPASGILLAMGFGQGPGQANNVGSTYEALGFVGGQSYGLSIAASGFLIACTVGVFFLNKRKKKNVTYIDETSNDSKLDIFQDKDEIPIAQSIDKLSVQAALIVFVYLLTFGFLVGFSRLLGLISPGLANTLNPILWGFNFIFASAIASGVAGIITLLRKKGIMKRQYQNNYLLNRISGLAFDVMIIAGIASIDFSDISKLWIPFLITILAGTIGTYFWLKFMTNKIYKGYEAEGFLSMFGMLTGTISSGVLLVREIDPEYKTPAANNLVTGSGTAIIFGAPLLVLIGLAPKSLTMTLVVLGLVVVYLAFLLFMIFKLNKAKYNE
jgi:ESS family glutamate:Na+ symporter